MPAYNDRDPRRNPGARPTRPSNGARPAAPRANGTRPAPHPQGQRPAGNRPSQGRRPAPRRRRRAQPRFFVIAALLVLLIVGVSVHFAFKGGDKPVNPQPLPTVAPDNNGMSNVTISSQDPGTADNPEYPDFSLEAVPVTDDEEEEDNTPKISASEQVQVSPEKLSINTSLPNDWINILLLGTDERSLTEPARTDAMIIASINPTTGEVKLTSLLRDTAVKFTDAGKYNGTYRLNAANYFGGPLYAIKIVNECFNMNIQYYVSVNFYGFTRIAEALGGIDVDITEDEMNEINKKQVHQYHAALKNGVDETGIENELLETYGANTHLNGRQTLAYARVRYVDNDMARAERQRTVVIKLTEKLRGKSAPEILALLANLSGYVTTNMDLNTIGEIAITVLTKGVSNMKTLRLPENGTYKLDRRNDQEMLYDTDWDRNSLVLYNFIYG